MEQLTIAEKIRILRDMLGLSKRRLAKRLKLNPSTIGLWESGKRYPTIRHCMALMMLLWEERRLEVYPQYFKRGEDHEYEPPYVPRD